MPRKKSPANKKKSLRSPRRKASPDLVERYLKSPSLVDQIFSGQMPLPGPGMARGAAVGIARYTGQSLASRALREAAQRMAKMPAPGTKPAPVSPWVRRAQQGTLPTKDMTMGGGPRADVYRAAARGVPSNVPTLGEVIRATPYFREAGLAETGRAFRSELKKMSAKRKAKPMPKRATAKPAAPAPTRRIASKISRGLPSVPNRKVSSGAGVANRRTNKPRVE